MTMLEHHDGELFLDPIEMNDIDPEIAIRRIIGEARRLEMDPETPEEVVRDTRIELIGQLTDYAKLFGADVVHSVLFPNEMKPSNLKEII